MLTQEQLQQILSYNPETGIFTYVKQTSSRNYVGKDIVASPSVRYLQVQIEGTFYLLHRLAFLYMKNRIPKEVDHVNGNKLDNSFCNLREVTHEQNQWNKGKSSNNTTGVKGIVWCGYSHLVNPRQHYSAKVRIGNGSRKTKCFSVSQYGSKEKALEQAEQWVIGIRDSLHKEYGNHGNS